MERTIKKVLVANRGVPAVRVMHTCRDRNIPTTAVYSSPDRLAHHVFMADSAVHIGEAPPVESYLNMDRMVDAALRSGSDAIHPGWGFLAENEAFAQKVIDAGLLWIGPPPKVIHLMGDKIQAKQLARKAGVPVIPGVSNVTDAAQITTWMAEEHVVFPIIIKASAGGGGKGMIKVDRAEDIAIGLAQARSEAKKSFGDETILVEKYIERGRHIEVQIVADSHGNVAHLYERECTLQRRNQKIIEEAPSPSLDENLRNEICFTATRLMREIGYVTAGTVEYIFDSSTRKFYFLEVNTRLQVEHGVTEEITGLDLVAAQLRSAAGERLHEILPAAPQARGHAIQARVYAEDPKRFLPSPGKLAVFAPPSDPGIRVETGYAAGREVTPYYDPLLAKVIARAETREAAIDKLVAALQMFRIEGVKHNVPALVAILDSEEFRDGRVHTGLAAQIVSRASAGAMG